MALRTLLRRDRWRQQPRRIEGTSLDGFDAALVEQAIERLRRFPPYRNDEYLRRNPDVAQAGLDPAWHAICYGAYEGRHFFAPDEAARAIQAAGEPPGTSPLAGRVRGLRAVRVHANASGNSFLFDIARALTHDLAEAGIDATLSDETGPRPNRRAVSIIVAPHEFFMLGAGGGWRRDDVIRGSIMLCTEQVQTPWFAHSLPYALMARGVIDLSFQAAALFRATGLAAVDYLPGAHRPADPLSEADRAHPLFANLPAAARRPADPATPLRDRALDIAYFGTDTPRRSAFFAANAARLGGYASCFARRPAAAGPIRLSGSDGSLTRLAAHISAHARISLNIHQDEIGYFEWHRLVRLGMASGSVVVSEPCARQRGFVPGTHYLEATLERIPDLLDWLLRSAEGQAESERIRRQALAVMSDQGAKRQDVARLCRFLAERATASRPLALWRSRR